MDGDSEKSSRNLLANDMVYGKYDEYKEWSRLRDMIMIQCMSLKEALADRKVSVGRMIDIIGKIISE